MPNLVEIAQLTDPEARLAAELANLDELIHTAKNRTRKVNGKAYIDPDGNTVTKAMDLAHRLIEEAAKRRGTDRESPIAAGYEAKINELRGVLQAYETMELEDWLALRQRYLR